MNIERTMLFWLSCYGWLLRCYPRAHRDRFGAAMQQTFRDLLQEDLRQQGHVGALPLWLFAETLLHIVKENLTVFVSHNRKFLLLVAITGGLLLVPLVAMQFTEEVSWSPGDFIIAGGLFMGCGLVYLALTSQATTPLFKAAAGLAVATALWLVWLNLAVGLIGNEAHPANALFLAVLLAGFAGSLWARLQPARMARVMFLMAALQTAVPLIAALLWGLPASSGPLEVAGLTAMFDVLWLASAWLFVQAAKGKRGGEAVIAA